MRDHSDQIAETDRTNSIFLQIRDDLSRRFAGAGDIEEDDICIDLFNVDLDAFNL